MLMFAVIVIVAMTVSFICSVLEACLVSLSRLDILRLAEHKATSAAIWRRLKTNVQKPLAAILIINTLANVMGSFPGRSPVNDLFGGKFNVACSIIFSLMLIQWCEILAQDHRDPLQPIHRRRIRHTLPDDRDHSDAAHPRH